VALPPGPWPSVLDFLVWRFPAVGAARWTARIAGGEVCDDQGRPVAASQAYRPHGRLSYYRRLPPEPRLADDETVLFEDAWLVVADKPQFLPVTPGGRYLQETLLVRLRRRLGIDQLAPLHRIDRETAGLVLFAKQPATRAAYHALFAQRAVAKSYQAIAGWLPGLALPLTRSSRLVAGSRFMQMREQGADEGDADHDGGPHNAITTVSCLERQGPWARYLLQPVTGQRHQLRVHMAALGLPLLGDQMYPVLGPEGSDDPANPLRLLAQAIAFVDPFTGLQRRFESGLRLDFPVPAD
jgi:tRNA pseudouridine32 synthase/23S rRNA pseudouridine746 synthase